MFKFYTLKFQNLNSTLNFTLKIWILSFKIWKYTLVPKIKSQVKSWVFYTGLAQFKVKSIEQKNKVFYIGLAQLHCNLLVVLFKWSWLAQNSISLAIKKPEKSIPTLSYVLPRKAINTCFTSTLSCLLVCFAILLQG